MKLNGLYLLNVDCEYYDKIYIYVSKQIKKNEYFVRFAVPSHKSNICINGVDLEYVKTRFTWYEERFLPLGNPKNYKSQIEERTKIDYFPNEYGMLFTYLTRIRVTKSFKERLNYLGVFDLELPKDEFIPWTIYNTNYIYYPNEIEESVLDSYRLYNLEQSDCFDVKIANKCRAREKEIIDAMIAYLNSLNK